MLEKIKTAAIVIMLAGNVFQAWLKKGPCEAINEALNAVGVEDVFISAEEPPEVGPPAPGYISIHLAAGQMVTVSQNGEVIVQ